MEKKGEGRVLETFFIVTGLNIPKALWKWVTLGTRHTDTILQFRNKQQHRALRGCGAQNMQERSCSYRLVLLQPPLHLLGQSEQPSPPLRVIVIGRGEQEPPLPSRVQLTSQRLHRVLNSESVPSKKNNLCRWAAQGHKHKLAAEQYTGNVLVNTFYLSTDMHLGSNNLK